MAAKKEIQTTNVMNFNEQLRVLDKKRNSEIDREDVKKYFKSPDRKRQTMECLYSINEINAVYDVFKHRLDCATRLDYTQIALRNITMYICSLSIGLRANDFCTLRWCDLFDEAWNYLDKPIYIPEKTIRVKRDGSKTKKEIVLTWSREFEVYLDTYLKWQLENIGERKLTDYIFLSRKGGHVCREEWWKIMNKACKEAGIKQKIGTHGLRKTMAHHYIMSSEDKHQAALEIMDMLGHSSLKTTLIYACIDSDVIKRNKDSRLTFIQP